MQRVGHAMQRAGHATTGAVSRAGHATTDRVSRAGHATTERIGHVRERTTERIGHARDRTSEFMENTRERVGEKAALTRERVADVRDDIREKARHGAQQVREGVETVREEVEYRSGEVAESGRRARVAPAKIRGHVKEGFQAWKQSVAKMAAMLGVVAIVGLTAWVVLTIGLVTLFANFIGLAGGALLVALLYVLIAGGAFMYGRSQRQEGRARVRQAKTDTREEVRHVVRPLRNAVGSRNDRRAGM